MFLVASANPGDLIVFVDAYQCGLGPGATFTIRTEEVTVASLNIVDASNKTTRLRGLQEDPGDANAIVLTQPLSGTHPMGAMCRLLSRPPAAPPSAPPQVFLRWMSVGSRRPLHGEPLINSALSQALNDTDAQAGVVTFTADDYAAFGIEDVRIDSFILSADGNYFRPLDPDVEDVPSTTGNLNMVSNLVTLQTASASASMSSVITLFLVALSGVVVLCIGTAVAVYYQRRRTVERSKVPGSETLASPETGAMRPFGNRPPEETAKELQLIGAAIDAANSPDRSVHAEDDYNTIEGVAPANDAILRLAKPEGDDEFVEPDAEPPAADKLLLPSAAAEPPAADEHLVSEAADPPAFIEGGDEVAAAAIWGSESPAGGGTRVAKGRDLNLSLAAVAPALANESEPAAEPGAELAAVPAAEPPAASPAVDGAILAVAAVNLALTDESAANQHGNGAAGRRGATPRRSEPVLDETHPDVRNDTPYDRTRRLAWVRHYARQGMHEEARRLGWTGEWDSWGGDASADDDLMSSSLTSTQPKQLHIVVPTSSMPAPSRLHDARPLDAALRRNTRAVGAGAELYAPACAGTVLRAKDAVQRTPDTDTFAGLPTTRLPGDVARMPGTGHTPPKPRRPSTPRSRKVARATSSPATPSAAVTPGSRGASPAWANVERRSPRTPQRDPSEFGLPSTQMPTICTSSGPSPKPLSSKSQARRLSGEVVLRV